MGIPLSTSYFNNPVYKHFILASTQTLHFNFNPNTLGSKMKTSMFLAALAVIGGATAMPAQAETQAANAGAAISAKSAPAAGAAQQAGQSAANGQFFVGGYNNWYGGYPRYSYGYGYPYAGYPYGGYPYGGYPY